MIDNPAEPSVEPALFALPTSALSTPLLAAAPAIATTVVAAQGVRLRLAQREQVAWGCIDLGSTLPPEHPARAIWAIVERLDLSTLYAEIEARGEVAGAPAIDPKILLALWIFATSDGEGSAREIWRLTQVHDAYR